MGDPVGIHESMLPGCHCCLLDNPGLLCWPLVEARVVHRVFCEHLGAIKEVGGNRRPVRYIIVIRSPGVIKEIIENTATLMVLKRSLCSWSSTFVSGTAKRVLNRLHRGSAREGGRSVSSALKTPPRIQQLPIQAGLGRYRRC